MIRKLARTTGRTLVQARYAAGISQRTATFGTDAALYSDTVQEVEEAAVKVTVVDYLGHRHTKLGRVGQSIDVCRTYDMDLLECDTVHGGGNDECSMRCGPKMYSEKDHIFVVTRSCCERVVGKNPKRRPARANTVGRTDSDQKTANSRSKWGLF